MTQRNLTTIQPNKVLEPENIYNLRDKMVNSPQIKKGEHGKVDHLLDKSWLMKLLLLLFLLNPLFKARSKVEHIK